MSAAQGTLMDLGRLVGRVGGLLQLELPLQGLVVPVLIGQGRSPSLTQLGPSLRARPGLRGAIVVC